MKYSGWNALSTENFKKHRFMFEQATWRFETEPNSYYLVPKDKGPPNLAIVST
ncbi:hypothetical protein ACFWM3_12165 [Gottfriedia sp. NPDC058432]|uniref:hypothetical protein n=1 Tax=Gottfriedia sp. NPDC058432 TaxID=3346497 RepID=UPI00365F5AD8